MTELIKKAYDPENFRQQGHQMVDLLADYFAEMVKENTSEKVSISTLPDALYEQWKEDVENVPHGNNEELFKRVLKETIHMHHPKYIGHQTSIVAPMSALAELLGASLDPGMGIYEQGTAGVVLERLISKRMGKLIGWGEGCDGFMTSGGTLGNLTALLCARQVMVKGDVWENGYEGKQYAFMVSSEAHFSVAKAVKVMGLGSRGVVAVPVDSDYRMRADMLETCFEKVQKENIEVIGVVASSCSTATGSYDPLDEIAAFCEAKKIWLHVDGAHGACVMFSEKYRHLLKGIERADSVTMDFHKMLMVPSLVTSVLFKNGEHSYQTFAQKASYLWNKDESREWYNLGKRTFELTKSFMSIRVYALWRKYGTALFEQNVDHLYDLARVFAKMIENENGFEILLSEPESNIVCFRYVQKGWTEEEIEKTNLKIRKQLIADGDFFILQTRVQGKLYLRTTIMNPFTTVGDLEGLLKEIVVVAAK